MARSAVLGITSLLVAGACAPGEPENVRVSQGASFDEVVVEWAAPSSGADSYRLYVSTGGGWERIASDIPAEVRGVIVDVPPELPELLTLSFRMRSERDGRTSGPSKEAPFLRGLRPPEGLVGTPLPEQISLRWTRRSTRLQGVEISRASLDAYNQPGPYEVVAYLPPDATEHADVVTPQVTYAYQVSSAAQHDGRPVRSLPAELGYASTPTAAQPIDLQANVTPDGVLLTWTPRSTVATQQWVMRARGVYEADDTNPVFGPLTAATPGATSWLDRSGAGAFTYRIAATAGASWHQGHSAPAYAAIAPTGLMAEVVVLPPGPYFARDGRGWWVATEGGLNSGQSIPTTFWEPVPGGWDERPVADALESARWAEPGVLLGPDGVVHTVRTRWVASSVPGPVDLVHAWRDQTGWHEEIVTTQSDGNGPARFGLAQGGSGVQVVWTTGHGAELIRPGPDGWLFESVPGPGGDPADVSFGAGGVIHVLYKFPSLEVWTRALDGSWTHEAVPGATERLGRFDLAAGGEGLAVLTISSPFWQGDPGATVAFASSGVWDPPTVLVPGAESSSSPISSAASDDRAAFTVPLDTPGGLWLYARGPEGGWTVKLLRTEAGFNQTWTALDGDGKVLVLVPGSDRWQDGRRHHVLYSED